MDSRPHLTTTQAAKSGAAATARLQEDAGQQPRLSSSEWVHLLVTGLLVALVGYASSVAVVIQGLSAVGATTDQITSALVAVGFSMGVVAMALSLRARMPISIAWSTPGLALLAATGPVQGGFAAAVGAFIATGLMIMAAGLWPALGRWVGSLPKPLANGMLAGILLKLCLAPFTAMTQVPVLALLVLAAWAIMTRFARLWAVPAAVLVALAGMVLGNTEAAVPVTDAWPTLTWVEPIFTWEAMVSIALPLFIVTMASQNIPGLAVLAANNYRPAASPAFLATGFASAVTAPLGGPTINFAAMTAALCAGPDAHPDPGRRYLAAVFSGVGYILFTAIAGVTASLVVSSPPILIQAVAGLALIGAFGGALMGAVQDETGRIPALVTFLVTASGLSFAGIGSPFWGLLIGGLLHVLYGAWPISRKT